MNISTLLHHEVMLVARTRAVNKYDAPKFTLREEIEAIRVKRVKKLDFSPLDEAREFYMRIARLTEYNQLMVEIDNAVYLIFEKHKFGVKDKSITRFWKYYIPLIKTVHKSQRMDCARYAYLRTLDEADQEATFGSVYRPDVSNIREYERRVNALKALAPSRKSQRAEQWHRDQVDRPLYNNFVEEDGSIRSAYAVQVADQD